MEIRSHQIGLIALSLIAASASGQTKESLKGVYQAFNIALASGNKSVLDTLLTPTFKMKDRTALKTKSEFLAEVAQKTKKDTIASFSIDWVKNEGAFTLVQCRTSRESGTGKSRIKVRQTCLDAWNASNQLASRTVLKVEVYSNGKRIGSR